MPEKRTRIFTIDFWLLFVASFVCCAIYYLLFTLMASFAIASFACSQGAAGAAASIFMVGAVVGRFVSGQMTGKRRMPATIAGYAIMLVACLLYFAAHLAFPLLIVIRLIHGLAFGICGTLVQVLAMESMPHKHLGEGVGYFTLSVTLGTALGPMMGLLVVNGLDYNVLFAVCSACSAAGLIAMLVARARRARNGRTTQQPSPQHAPAHPNKHAGIFSIIDRATWKFSLAIFIFAVAYAPINAFMYNYATELGFGMYAPFVFLVYAAALLACRPLAGKLLDARGSKTVLVPSVISMAVGLALCACANTPIMLLAVGIFMATGFGTALSSAQAAVTKMHKDSDSTLAVSTLFVFADAGCAFGPMLLGCVATAAGYRIMYAACAVVALVCLAYFLLVAFRAKSNEGQSPIGHG